MSFFQQMGNELEGDGRAASDEPEPHRAAAGAVASALAMLRDAPDALTLDALHQLRALFERVAGKGTATSLVQPRVATCSEEIARRISQLTVPDPNINDAAAQLVLSQLPAFVYYSSYGNLDSEIYLPHVIDNMKRGDLGAKEEAKARTLKVLFEFVKLQPEEILSLGKDAVAVAPDQAPTQAQIEATAEKKKERDILLRSADTQLTRDFRSWWQQGDYRFRFAADGDHFRIWVSDDLRPEEVELELRSTGLQWFLSFFLVFLVESRDAHKGSILLLDEPGHSLHPIAQKDLSRFFNQLSGTNQLIYTTHSPFLVDADRLDRVRSVFIGDDGTTRVSPDLRASPAAQSLEARSVYAVHAALQLTVSDVMLQGCAPVVVEGQSDQHYLSAMKTLLIGAGKIKPTRELMFLPAGGFKGVTALVAVLAGKDEVLPPVLVDSDKPGLDTANKLEQSQYKHAKDRIVRLGDVLALPNAEVEDLAPASLFADVVSRMLRTPDEDFSDVIVAGEPVVPQVERFATRHKLKLADGWKVDLARAVKGRLLRAKPNEIDAVVPTWVKLFERLM